MDKSLGQKGYIVADILKAADDVEKATGIRPIKIIVSWNFYVNVLRFHADVLHSEGFKIEIDKSCDFLSTDGFVLSS